MSVVDHGLTKGVILIPTNKDGLTAEKTAQHLLDNLYKHFSLPDKFISDQGSQFKAESFREFLKLLEIESSLSTAYHPQTDGTTKCFNQEIETYLSIFCTGQQESWADELSLMEFVHNSRRHSDRQHSPFELILGIQPHAIPQMFASTKFGSVEEKVKHLEQIRKEAITAHELAVARMASRLRSTFKPFKKGEKVWLNAKNLKLPYATKKISTKREGPFLIKDVLGPVTYRLSLPDSWKIHDIFHAALLTPFRETDTHGPAFTKPAPDLVDDEEHQEVERIVKHRM
ncbi:unnamed protein product [Cyclocybe aegerita]|uniref:Integrase catalytic domain-containing protein n=1 Tax=Cyclocybe aegerita TaxID=1973307 RepID=A0A8S0WES0_CYCAE|nr:unnamed protein product [Cyclocybe aegerita]